MKAKTLSALVILALFGVSQQTTRKHPVRQEVIDEIKLKADTWTPMELHQNKLRDVHPENIKKRLGNKGTQPNPFSFLDKIFKWSPFGHGIRSYAIDKGFMKIESSHPVLQQSIPDSYDFREHYPNCTRYIRDQGDCGACWAFTGSGMLADRICKMTDGQVNVELSIANMVDCSLENFACQGGYLMNALDYLMNEGTVSEECQPYKEEQRPCTYKCHKKQTEFKKYFCAPGTLKILTTKEQIKHEIMNNGPVMVGLSVFEDFLNYAKGDYKQISANLVGGHAVKMLGWRTTNSGQTSWLI